MLAARIGSAIVLIPLVVAAVWLGFPWVVLMVALAAGVMAWEWAKLTDPTQNSPEIFVWVAAAAAAVFASPFSGISGALAVGFLGIAIRYALNHNGVTRWAINGFLWLILGCAGFVWLRQMPEGRALTLWLLLIVWAIDTGAYIVGRTVGGRRLAPRISPNKTWSGLIGGIVAGAVVGAALGPVLEPNISPFQLGLLSAGLAIVEQIGDIAESYAKRRFGVKDSSTLIPGHGGLLDRLDGMLAVIAAVVLLNLLGVKVW